MNNDLALAIALNFGAVLVIHLLFVPIRGR